MGELIFLIAIIAWAVKSGKDKKKKQQKSFQTVSRPERKNSRAQWVFETAPANQPTPFSFPTEEHKRFQIAEGESCDGQISLEEAFRGSMPDESTEGECICDPDLEHERIQNVAPGSVYQNEIGKESLVDFSARGMMQGFVMSEILTRPAQRVRRR